MAKREDWTPTCAAGLGRALHESVPADERPSWAASVLERVLVGRGLDEELDFILVLASDESRWREAHAGFQKVRSMTLAAYEAPRAHQERVLVLAIAESVLKIVYNASSAPTPFDHHAGWRLVPRVKALVEHIGDEAFEETCWTLLAQRFVA